MTVLAANPKFQGWDNNGNLLVGGKLYTYSAGTTTAKPTYADAALTSANSNPVILDARGEAIIYLAAGGYKFVLKDANDVTIWTVDNIDGGASGYGWYPYAQDTGAANAYAISVSPGPASYAAGQIYLFRPNAANTGASTLNINGLGAKTIVKNVNDSLLAGDIQQNSPALVLYDGTNFQLVNPLTIYADGAGNIIFGRTEKARFNVSGNFGIGTASPTDVLHLLRSSATNVLAKLQNSVASFLVGVLSSGAGYIEVTGANDMRLITNGTDRLRLGGDGTVRTGNVAAATGYTSAGDITLPSAGKIYALNTAKWWINLNGNGTISTRSSYNIASVTDNGVGNWMLNFSNALADANYCGVGSAGETSGTPYGDRQLSVYPISTTQCRLVCGVTGGSTLYDAAYVMAAGFGN